jgi:DNA gyrase subunit A
MDDNKSNNKLNNGENEKQGNERGDSKEQIQEIGYIKPREIVEEMKDSYIDYAMSVIVSRALPDVRDGLKPVHRRILFAMLEEGLRHNVKTRKSATVVGAVLGRYHPHGDVAVYDSLVRMAQDFSLRYPLVHGQGNFGSIDGDSSAAMRYTESKLSKLGEEMLKNIERETVDFRDNYDATRKEPVVLPSPVPQLLLNGTLGIAVGMATSIPPHNLSEVVDATIHLIDNPKADTRELFKFIKGPDFPLGGMIYNQKDIIEAYSVGKGPIEARGKAEIIEDKKGRDSIIITEIPYQVQKSGLVQQIAKLVQEKKIVGVKTVRDESDRDGMRIVIEMSKDAFPQKILNRLYKFSDLQKTFHINMLALVDGIQPKVLSLSEVLTYFVEHKKQVVVRRTQYDLKKAQERAHILEGLHKCLSKIDEVIKIIKASKNREDAQNNLMKRFKLTEIQANAILEMKLANLAKLERQRIEDELKEKQKMINEFRDLLASPKKIKGLMKKELQEMKDTFGDDRRTKVFVQKIGEIAEEDLIPQEETVITLTHGGYIKRVNPDIYKIQKRGGKGIMGMKTLGEDVIEHFISCQTHDSLLFFTDSGRVFKVPAYEIPEAARVAKGRGILNFLEITPQEKILSVFSIGKEDEELGIKYLVMATKNGIIKRTELNDFKEAV